MAIDTKELMAAASWIRRALVHAIRLSYRFALAHPSVPAVVFFMLTLYISFPSLFSLLVSLFPVILCTTLLLGALLMYGEPNLPEIQEASSLKAQSARDDRVIKKNDESTAVVTRFEGKEETSASSSSDEEEGYEKERQTHDRGFADDGEFSVRKQAEGSGGVGVGVSGGEQEENMVGLMVNISKPSLESNFDSSLGSPWQPIDIHDAASDSEGAVSSSTDASMTDIIPMLDELHPLLDPETSQPADGLGAGSSGHEAEHQEEKEVQEEKDGGNREAVRWTADDQRNLMDLGTSEIERNRRLESMIAKRRARKNLRPETEKNLIDFDSSMEGLNLFHVQIPPISATRKNSFDVSSDYEKAMGLPPIPSSAPSAPHRRNPFDLPLDEINQSCCNSTESLIHQIPQQDIFFQRRETSSLGPSFTAESSREEEGGNLESDFISERVEEAGFTTLERQFGKEDDSKFGSFPESEMNSSVIEQENHINIRKEMHQETELFFPAIHDDEPVGQQSQSVEEVHSAEVDNVEGSINVGIDHSVDMSPSVVTRETHQEAAGTFLAVEKETRDIEFDFPFWDTSKVGITQDMYDETSSLASPEVNSPEMSIQKGSSGDSCDSTHPLPASFDLPVVDDSQIVSSMDGPSLSAIVDSLYNMSALHEASSNADISELGSPQQPAATMDENFVPTTERILVARLFSADEIESKSREMAEVTEHDVMQIGLSGVHEDPVNPTSLATPGSIDELVVHPSSLISIEPRSDEAHLSLEKSTLQQSRISVLGLPPIPEESFEDSKREEHESVVCPAVIAGLQSMEDTASGLRDDEESGNIGNTTEPVHEPRYDDDSVISPIVEQVLGPRETMKTSSLLDTKLDLEAESHSAIDLRGQIINEIERGGDFTTMLNEEPLELHAEDEIDEGLLSELDVIGDFGAEDLRLDHLDREIGLQSDGQLPDNISDPLVFIEAASVEDTIPSLGMESGVGSTCSLDPETTVYNPRLRVLEACSFQELDSAFKKLYEESAALSGPEEESEVDSGLQVLEARSIEDINSAFKQLAKVGLDEDKLDPEMELQSAGQLADNDADRLVVKSESDSELEVLEAKPIDNIDSAFKQLDKVGLDEDKLDPEMELQFAGQLADNDADRLVVKSESDSELKVLEAKPIDNIDSATKAGLDGSEDPEGKMNLEPAVSHSDLHVIEADTAESQPKPLESCGSEGSESRLEPEVLQVQATATMEAGSEVYFDESEISKARMSLESDMQIVEAKTLEDIRLALDLSSDGSVAESQPKLLESIDDIPVSEESKRQLEPDASPSR